MTTEDHDILADVRAELAALGRDMTYVQKEISEMRAIFGRLVWLVVAGLMAGFLQFTIGGGLSV